MLRDSVQLSLIVAQDFANMAGIKLQGPRLHLLVAAVGALAFLLQGYDQAVINGLLSLSTWEKTFPQIDTSDNKSHERSLIQGTAVAIYEVGCAIGALSCFIIGDILGRRRTIFGASCFVIVGVTIQASSFSLGQLIAARITTGLGVGAFTGELHTTPLVILLIISKLLFLCG